MIRLEIEKREDNVRSIAEQVFSRIFEGGLVLLPDGFGYGLIGHSEKSVQRIYVLKERASTKPLTHYMNTAHFPSVGIVSGEDYDLVCSITKRIPCCFVVPYKDTAYFRNLPDFSRRFSTKDGTVALFFEEDTLVQQLLKLSLRENFPLIVSSANRSGEGNTYRFQDVPENICRGTDVVVYDNKPCKYFHEASEKRKALGSTIVDLSSKHILRRGILVSRIEKLLGEAL